jgi:hypothetical protein
MYIDLRTPGVRLPRGRAHALLLRVRSAFACVAHGIARIVVRVTPTPGGTPAARDCAVEVHLQDGRIEVVQVRQRRLGSALTRALLHAWERTQRSLGMVPAALPQPRLYAPLHARLAPAGAARRSRRSSG